jgi:hypothetical protein
VGALLRWYGSAAAMLLAVQILSRQYWTKQTTDNVDQKKKGKGKKVVSMKNTESGESSWETE